jgi:hypothetical protein
MTTEKDKVANDILAKFKSLNLDEHRALPARWLSLIYYPTLTQPQKAVFQDTIRDMITMGIVKSVRNTIMLTKEGVEKIYPRYENLQRY